MVDFRKLISPKSRAENRRIAEQIMAFQKLQPGEMAEELLGHSRKLIDSGAFSTDQRYSYDEWALYRIIPEIALRLDPRITLRNNEHPSVDERADNVTWLRGESIEKLLSAVSSILSNGSFRRAQARDTDGDVRFSVEVLFGSNPNIFTVAADTISSGFLPERVKPDERDPLPGVYLIGSTQGGYDKVFRYKETQADIARDYDVLRASCRGDELSEEDQMLKERFFIGLKPSSIREVSLQTFDGEVLQSEVINIADPDESLSPAM